MAVTLRRLLEYVKDEELQILSGEDNIDRVVRWTHVVEAIRQMYHRQSGNGIDH